MNFSQVCPCADKKVIAFNTRSKSIVSAAVKASLVAAVPAKISPIEASLSNTDWIYSSIILHALFPISSPCAAIIGNNVSIFNKSVIIVQSPNCTGSATIVVIVLLCGSGVLPSWAIIACDNVVFIGLSLGQVTDLYQSCDTAGCPNLINTVDGSPFFKNEFLSKVTNTDCEFHASSIAFTAIAHKASAAVHVWVIAIFLKCLNIKCQPLNNVYLFISRLLFCISNNFLWCHFA